MDRDRLFAARVCALFALGLLAPRARAAEPVKVSVLSLRSFRADPGDLAAASGELASKLATADPALSVVDAVRPLVDRGSERWLEADHLLYEGIEQYGKLDYADAVESLKESLAISEETWREYADLQGPRRVRDTCLYLGLARLEQGAGDDAAAWFRRAARVDPGYELDARQFSPAARAAWAQARKDLSGPPMETSLERLAPMALAIGADVLVTGGVDTRDDGSVAVQLVIADRRKGLLTEQSVAMPNASRAELLRAVDEAIPQVVARILDRPVFDPRQVASRLRWLAGLEERLSPGARVDTTAIFDRYRWRGTLPITGVSASLAGLRAGPIAIEPGIALFPTQPMGGRFVSSPLSSTGTVTLGLAARVYALAQREQGRWLFAAGPGLEAGYAILVFRSQTSVAPVSPSWAGPAGLLLVRRHLGDAAAVQAALGGEYDPVGHAPAPVSWRVQVSAGTAF